MRTRRLILLAVVLAAVALNREDLAGQNPPNQVAASLAENSNLYFVELASPPTIEGSSPTQVRNEKAAFRRNAALAGISFQQRFEFDELWNGVAIRVTRGRMSDIAKLDGVVAVYPIEPVPMPETTPGETPELATALAMTGADIAQSELGLTGRGVRVAVMDTGIDYDHPDLGGCFGPGCRVRRGYDFVGDAYNNDPDDPAFNPNPVPDNDPDDCNGHGTHVAGIVGANGTVKGVAPEVTLQAYRVFGCDGSTSADIMIAAMERAYRDGADVLNMSIGAAFQWPQYPTGQAASRLVQKGVVVVASAGNQGTSGLYASSAPGVADKVIGVAAFDNTHDTLPYFTVSPDGAKVGYHSATGAPPAPTSGSALMARTGTPTTANDACAPLPAGSLAGQVALIRRGTCSFYVKAFNAQTAGATGVVLYNNAAGRVSPTVAGTPAITIPVVAITAADGLLINNRIAAGAVTMTWTDQVQPFPNTVNGGLISSFSSYGPTADLQVKPDIGAPGGSIYSTYPLELGGFANLSGTSMAAPHVAGAAALLLEAEPHIRAEQVRGRLQNSADPKPWWGNPGLGFLDNVHRQGAGMLDIDDAITADATVTPAKIALGESEFGPVTRKLTIDNDSHQPVTYTLTHEPALSTGPNTFTVGFNTGFAMATFSSPTVTVPRRGRASVNVTIAANPALADRSVYGGYIVLTPQGGGQVYRVPYAGFKGDYQSIPVLVPTPFGFPWLTKLVGDDLVNQPDGGATYTMAGDDVPYFVVHLDHQSRRLRLKITHVATGLSWFRALQEDYLQRNSTPTAFSVLPWDGTITIGRRTIPVPDGQYQMTMTVLKALGDESNPAHVETWESPTFTIARTP